MSRVDLSTVGDEDTDWGAFDPDEDAPPPVKPPQKQTVYEVDGDDDDRDLLLFKMPDVPTSTNKTSLRELDSQHTESNFDTSLIAGSFKPNPVDNSLLALFGEDDDEKVDAQNEEEKSQGAEDEEDFLIRTQPFISSTQNQVTNVSQVRPASSRSESFQFKKPPPPSPAPTIPNHHDEEEPIVLGTQTPAELISDINNNSGGSGGGTKSPQRSNTSFRGANSKAVELADLVAEVDMSIWNFARADLYKLFNSSRFNQRGVFDALTLKYYYEKVHII
jgi:hypothetical protein